MLGPNALQATSSEYSMSQDKDLHLFYQYNSAGLLPQGILTTENAHINWEKEKWEFPTLQA